MRIYIAVLAILISLTACAGQRSDYRADAEAFCKLHSKEQWDSRKGYTAIENMDFLAQKIKETIKTKDFYEIFERLSKYGYDDFYSALQPEISKLIREEWNCEDAKKFYTISWERVDSVSEVKDVDVVVLKDGPFEINNKKYLLSDVQGISEAIKRVSKGNKYKITLSIPDSTTKEMINEYLEPFRKMKVKSLSITYYSSMR